MSTDEQGHFFIPSLSEGRHLLYAWFEGDDALREVFAPVEVRKSGAGPVRLRFEPGRTWTGRVEDALGRPLSEVVVTLSRGVSTQAAKEPSEDDPEEPLTVRVDAGEGRFVLESDDEGDEEAETEP